MGPSYVMIFFNKVVFKIINFYIIATTIGIGNVQHGHCNNAAAGLHNAND
jgi:hypothetical protein